ncbi:type IV toxin-antitoxin system AbiEi family antitoxin domain-containing protein [Lolliginicoccus levis]|uniref:type IV toxin-antitoxin system AbiEi family antitoxin domain-containing protein n=1 Tax=Lolliginicoccus levis TaxID=2919542 RepID=UPI00241E8971|nr:type IV toxin-antitoxin system AbiEi family antitoxin domain-containing protein [Lolliginicoccus levis]
MHRVEPSTATRIPRRVAEALAAGNGLTTANDPVAVQQLSALHRQGRLRRLARGIYAETDHVASLRPWERFDLASRAYLLSCGDGRFLAGWSAALPLGLPTIGAPPGLPSISCPGDGRVRTQVGRHGRTIFGPVPTSHLREANGMPVTSLGWTATTIALSASVPVALAVADGALRRGAGMRECLPHVEARRGAERARWVAAHASELAESPLESLGRFAAHAGGLPLPVPNAWVGDGRPQFRVDGLWPYHWAGFEADGALKYDNRPDASRIIADQQEREWLLRRMGIDLCRFGWRLAHGDPLQLAARFAQLLAAHPPREEPIRWWKHDPLLGPVEPAPGDWPDPVSPGLPVPERWWVDRR